MKQIFIWHTEGTSISGIFTLMTHMKNAFSKMPDVEVHFVNLNISPFKFTQTLPVEEFYDIHIKTPGELIAFIKKNLNAVHVHNHAYEYLEIAQGLAKDLLKRTTLIGICHTDQDYYYVNLKKYEDLHKGMIAVSDVCEKRLREILENKEMPITVLPDWNTPIPEKREIDFTPPYQMVFNGRMLNLQKRVFDLPILLKELDALNFPYHLTLIGEGPDRPELEQKLSEFGHKITILNAIAPLEMHEVLSKQHIFVQVSEFEGASVSLIEAMVHQLVPCVTTTKSGVELLKNDENALLSPIGDMKKMAESICSLNGDSERFKRISDHAYQSGTEYLRNLDYHPRFLQFIEQVAVENRTP